MKASIISKVGIIGLLLFMPLCNAYDSSRDSRDRCDDKSIDSEYDVIIVGAGTAGAVAAKRISDNKKISVLLLEAGGNQNDNSLVDTPFVFNPEVGTIGLFATAVNPETADNLVNAKILPNYDPVYARLNGGRGWGGSSNHNFLLAIRTSPQYADLLTAFGGAKWNSDNFNAIYQAIETYNGGACCPPPNANRGENGRYQITQVQPSTSNTTEFILQAMKNQSFDDQNVPIGLDYNANINRIFATNIQQFLKANEFNRSHTGEAFLGPDIVDQSTGKGVGKRKLKVISNAFVTRVLFCKGKRGTPKARFVEAVVDGKCKRFCAKRKIILCASGLRNPGILERSGIGAADVLKEAGVEKIVHINPNVGENLMAHVGPQVLFKLNDDVVIPPPTGQLTSVLKLLPGPTPSGQDRRLQVFLTPGLGIPGLSIPEAWIEMLGGFEEGTQIYSANNWNLQPTSKGSAHILNTDPQTNPFIAPEYLTSDEDLAFARESLRWWKRIEQDLQANHPELGMELVFPPTNTNFADDAALDSFISANLSITDHVCCTAAMGDQQTQGGVVDGHLHVHGVKNLMVADSSIWPIIPDCNTSLPATLVGWMAATIVLEEF